MVNRVQLTVSQILSRTVLLTGNDVLSQHRRQPIFTPPAADLFYLDPAQQSRSFLATSTLPGDMSALRCRVALVASVSIGPPLLKSLPAGFRAGGGQKRFPDVL
jgi:hypothetical protein